MAKIVREIVSLRREYEKHYHLDDGRYVAVVRGTPWHYRDPDGQYQDVDPIIVPDEEACGCERRRLPAVAAPLIAARRPVVAAATRAGCEPVPRYWHVLQAPYYALLPRRVTDGYQIHVDGVSVSVVPVDAAPVEGELVDAHTVTYRDVWPSTDLVLEAKEDRLKASIILRDEQSPTEFRFAVAGTRKDMAELAPPFAVDANGQYLPVTWRVDEEGGAEAALLVVALDTTGDVAFPVEIDPTTTVPSPSADAFVTNWRAGGRDSNWGSSDILYVRNFEPSYDFTFIRFSLPTLPAGATFQRADLRLYQVNQNAGGGITVNPVSARGTKQRLPITTCLVNI